MLYQADPLLADTVKISWWRDGEQEEGEGELLQVGDTGVYTCEVETRLDSSQAGPAEVVVYQPTVVKGPAMLETVAGRLARLQCQATLDPGLVDGAVWEWTRYLTYTCSCHLRNPPCRDGGSVDNQTGPELVILAASLEDTGDYRRVLH